MKIAIVGGGAIGTLIGNRLCRNGNTISVIDKGIRLQQIQDAGLALIDEDGQTHQALPQLITDDFRAAGQHDLVILAVKAHSLPQIAHDIPSLLGRDSVIITVQNGIPWWYFSRMDSEYSGTRIGALDPHGELSKNVSPASIVGCVAYPAAETLPDGRVQHVEGNRLPIGELDGDVLPRTNAIVDTFVAAGFKSRAIADIRSELWLKAWGALSINPISALTNGKMDEICDYPPTVELVRTMMTEAKEIAQKLSVTFRHTIDKRIAGAKAVGPHKTSMLQDLEHHREMEVEALIGSIVELAEITSTPAPSIKAIYACTKLLNQTSTREYS